MKELDVSKLERIKYCKIFDQAYNRNMRVNENLMFYLERFNTPYPLEFIDGLAIARVIVQSVDFYNNLHDYVTYAIVREVRDKETDEVVDYELVDSDIDYLKIPMFVKGIKRVGNHFFFDIDTTPDPDARCSYTAHWQIDYDKKTGEFTKVGKLDSNPVLTKSDDIVIIGDARLYSLGKGAYVSKSYSNIQDINGETFFVTDVVVSKENENGRLSNHLMFDIDKNGERITNVYSRNKGEFTDDTLDTPYEEIKIREREKLNDLMDKQSTYKLLLQVDREEQ